VDLGMIGKKAVVTGASEGIGKAIARAFALEGADIAICARRTEPLERTAADIGKESGREIVPIMADVAKEGDVESFINNASAALGKIDILVNNAGVTSIPVRTHEMAIADWDRVIATNLRGVFLCTRAVLPVMLEHGGGSIINIASIAGLRGYYPGVAAFGCQYSAAKAGLLGFTRQVAAEYACNNIRANVIAPGWHAGTRLGEERRAAAGPDASEAFERMITARTPMRRRGRLEELVGLAVYLAGDASSFVTGQIIAHDGGWTAV
jgi:NAD(P)-dependent dehydrogenase (short-subunit alcohol dehydrogenase family)